MYGFGLRVVKQDAGLIFNMISNNPQLTRWERSYIMSIVIKLCKYPINQYPQIWRIYA